MDLCSLMARSRQTHAAPPRPPLALAVPRCARVGGGAWLPGSSGSYRLRGRMEIAGPEPGDSRARIKFSANTFCRKARCRSLLGLWRTSLRFPRLQGFAESRGLANCVQALSGSQILATLAFAASLALLGLWCWRHR